METITKKEARKMVREYNKGRIPNDRSYKATMARVFAVLDKKNIAFCDKGYLQIFDEGGERIVWKKIHD